MDAVFKGLRPASTALIAAAGLSVALSVLVNVGMDSAAMGHTFGIDWLSLAIAVGVFFAMRVKKLKKLHPIVFIGISAVLGVIFQL